MELSSVKIRVVIVDDHPLVIEGLKALLKFNQDIKVVFTCDNGEALKAYLKNNEYSIVNQMIVNGAKGYLLKNVTETELVKAIKKVYVGKHYYGEEIQEVLANAIFHRQEAKPRLTSREKQILKLIVDGRTNNKIADELFISPLTVETHRRNLMKKMKASNTASLVKIAIKESMV